MTHDVAMMLSSLPQQDAHSIRCIYPCDFPAPRRKRTSSHMVAWGLGDVCLAMPPGPCLDRDDTSYSRTSTLNGFRHAPMRRIRLILPEAADRSDRKLLN
ncbi:hypothetical protein HGRIS_000489 [Hohenbuehelia grisea]|uniref:Uncharacterized protein n=1 Tax=Hohenbuehelia grisea TaxID=104357 RepID=A0ABR3JRU3_9AGAR